MNKVKIAIVGYGNLGRGASAAVKRNPDMELAQIISRDPDRVRKEVRGIPVFHTGDFKILADVAILCGGSKEDLFGNKRPATSIYRKKLIESTKVIGHGPYFAQYFNTVDSFDTHSRIPEYYAVMNKYAGRSGHTAVISAGWDPGIFSTERVLADSFIPGARYYTFWGPGVSQGHSDAVRRIKGVIDARQYTLPNRSAIKRIRSGKTPLLSASEKHRRLVYVVIEKGAERDRIEKEIRSMPDYFSDNETRVVFVSLAKLRRHHAGFPHAGRVISIGKTGPLNKAYIEYCCNWDSNPEATAGILVACARACYKLNRQKMVGAFTMLDIPPAYYSRRGRRELHRSLM